MQCWIPAVMEFVYFIISYRIENGIVYKYIEEDAYGISKTVANSPRTKPIRKCCCRNSRLSSEYRALSMLATLLMQEFWLLFEAVLGVGLHGAEINVYGVANGKFNAMKCS